MKNTKQKLREVMKEYNSLVISIKEVRKNNKVKEIIKEAAIQDMAASFDTFIYEK